MTAKEYLSGYVLKIGTIVRLNRGDTQGVYVIVNVEEDDHCDLIKIGTKIKNETKGKKKTSEYCSGEHFTPKFGQIKRVHMTSLVKFEGDLTVV